MRSPESIFLVSLVILLSFSLRTSAQWVQTGGPEGGGIKDVAVDHLLASGSRIFASSRNKVFLSTDNGMSWKASKAQYPGSGIRCLAAKGPALFASSGEPMDKGNHLVCISKDGGDNWIPIDSGLFAHGVNEVDCLIVKGQNLYACGAGGVLVTSDDGLSWRATDSGLPGWVFCLVWSGQNLFAGSFPGVFLSTDDGASWTAVNSGFPANAGVSCLAVVGTRVYAGTDDGGIFVTTDHGASWTPVNSGLPTKRYVQGLAASGTSLFACYVDEGIFRSTDGGSSWTQLSSGLPPVWCMTVKGTELFVGTNRGVWRLPLSRLSPTK
jgi:photosystem II stability/assembly factor-like uncharacterized protein